MTFENGTFYRIELPRMCPQSEISNDKLDYIDSESRSGQILGDLLGRFSKLIWQKLCPLLIMTQNPVYSGTIVSSN